MSNRRHRRPWPAVEERTMNVFSLLILLAIIAVVVVILFVFGCIIIGSLSDKEMEKYLNRQRGPEDGD